MPESLDQLNRPLRDLRISVTDRCNFRCRYCMPAEVFGPDYQYLPKSNILTHEETARVARAFVSQGVEKLRITGGEPLLRRGLPDLISMLGAISGVRDIAMTTNGTALARNAKKLKSAGLHRVTISMDALDPEVFARMNGVGATPERVIDGIDSALDHGLGVKINMVVQKGVNENQMCPLAEFARARGVTLRFIEFMDTGNTNGWKQDQVVSYADMLEELQKSFALHSIEPKYLGETAKRFRYDDLPDQEIGFITSVSKPFCSDCNRARLSADGQIFTCLFASHGHDIKSLLRANTSEKDLAEFVANIWSVRNDRYSEVRTDLTDPQPKPEMSYIGG
ncbi:MAG: GTP 3',8-cyclase MoaA [Akkermansiaceae bacterium]